MELYDSNVAFYPNLVNELILLSGVGLTKSRSSQGWWWRGSFLTLFDPFPATFNPLVFSFVGVINYVWLSSAKMLKHSLPGKSTQRSGHNM